MAPEEAGSLSCLYGVAVTYGECRQYLLHEASSARLGNWAISNLMAAYAGLRTNSIPMRSDSRITHREHR